MSHRRPSTFPGVDHLILSSSRHSHNTSPRGPSQGAHHPYFSAVYFADEAPPGGVYAFSPVI